MSTQDSFVDEVTDELRREKLFATFRKYGWIGGLIVLGIVGGAAWSEWQKAKAETRAEAFGAAVQAALEQPAGPVRDAALAAIPADGGQLAVLNLLLGAGTDKASALKALDALAADATQDQLYRDLATLRRIGLAGAEMPLADRRSALQAIAVPGRPFRTLAEEQLAYLALEEGKAPEALTALLALHEDQEAPATMKSRIAQVIVALGGTVPERKAPEGAAPTEG